MAELSPTQHEHTGAVPPRAPWHPGLLQVRRILLPAIFGIVVLAGWHFAVERGSISQVVLPPPGKVLGTIWANFSLLRQHGFYSAREALAALAISVLLGLFLALVISTSRVVRAAVYPNLLVFELVPKITLAPLFIIWVGTGSDSRLLFATFLAFFPVLVARCRRDLQPQTPCWCGFARRWGRRAGRYLRNCACPMRFRSCSRAEDCKCDGNDPNHRRGVHHREPGIGLHHHVEPSNMETSLMLAAILLLCLVGVALYGFVALLETLVNRRYGRPRA